MTMRATKLMGFLLAVFCCMGVTHAQVGRDLKSAGHDTADATKTAGHKTAHETRHIAHRTEHVTSRAARKSATGTRNIGRRIEGKPTLPNNPR
jgi:hypothetical protein